MDNIAWRPPETTYLSSTESFTALKMKADLMIIGLGGATKAECFRSSPSCIAKLMHLDQLLHFDGPSRRSSDILPNYIFEMTGRDPRRPALGVMSQSSSNDLSLTVHDSHDLLEFHKVRTS